MNQPMRDDDVARWLKRRRDENKRNGVLAEVCAWVAIDDLLEDYREHADTGTPLDAEVNNHEEK
jgi:hypothetical protein